MGRVVKNYERHTSEHASRNKEQTRRSILRAYEHMKSLSDEDKLKQGPALLQIEVRARRAARRYGSLDWEWFMPEELQ